MVIPLKTSLLSHVEMAIPFFATMSLAQTFILSLQNLYYHIPLHIGLTISCLKTEAMSFSSLCFCYLAHDQVHRMLKQIATKDSESTNPY